HEAHVDGAHLRVVGDDVAERSHPVREEAVTSCVEDLVLGDRSAGGDADGGDNTIRGDDAGDVGAVAVIVLRSAGSAGAARAGDGAGSAGQEALLDGDAAGKVGVRQVCAGIQHGYRDAGAGVAGGVGDIGADQRHTL